MQVKICCGFSDSSHAQHCAINTAGKKKKKTRSDGSGGYKSREEDSRKAKVISVKN